MIGSAPITLLRQAAGFCIWILRIYPSISASNESDMEGSPRLGMDRFQALSVSLFRKFKWMGIFLWRTRSEAFDLRL